ncbi:ABC transporter ATP-binding protein [Winogradskyella maritima]|uniref:ABC transporter ATP-binding protein n=1 Tax=Winogradskyella maritima TaxID=1517766 RepID=A0ABV8AK93_9FLAO|nr:ABC transporter ATP-binding protein [Winogradskyella maritima]
MSSKENHIVLTSEDLSIGYAKSDKQTIIANGLNFKLQKGQLVGLVGGNGIGKSTLLRSLSKIQPQLSGKIYINSSELSQLSNEDLAKSLSIVLTEPLQSKHLTVFELVALGRHPYTNWIGKLNDTDIEKINEALRVTNILDLATKVCAELSDGQLQKVMIARALAQDTDLIILDEPTTHLDMYHKAYILKLLQKLAHDTGKTILFSSHEIDLAIQLCDQMIVMSKNDCAFGSPCELIEQGVFEQLFPKDLIAFNKDTGSFKVNK